MPPLLLRSALSFLAFGPLAWGTPAAVAPTSRATDASTPAVAARSASGVAFFDPARIDVATLLPAPPLPETTAARAELETVLQVQAWRTEAQIAWARLTDASDFFGDFRACGIFTPAFNGDNLPFLAQLWQDVRAHYRAHGNGAKDRFRRPRPFQQDSRVKLCVDEAAGHGYPSGHATSAYLRAELLAALFPDQRSAIADAARRIAWGRVIAGAHYPSDLEAGRRLAAAVWTELERSPAFQARLSEVRAEIARTKDLLPGK